MLRTDDPVKDAETYEWEKNHMNRDIPECEECGYRVDEDYYYEFDGKVICPDCMKQHRKWIW